MRKYEQGAFDDDAQAADLLQECGACIAAMERLAGKQALELGFLKGALRNASRSRSGSISVITGPQASSSAKDAGDGARALDLLRPPARAADGTTIVEAVFAVCDAFEPPMAVSPPRQQGLELDVQPKARRRSVITPTAIMTARSSPIRRSPLASADSAQGGPDD
jgi:hypothetical protein